MNSEKHWTVYRTRFLVRARQLTEPFCFTDALGREHSGRPGDYLVESSEGCLRITAREIFEDVYVPLQPASTSENTVKRPILTPEFRRDTSRSEGRLYGSRELAEDAIRATA